MRSFQQKRGWRNIMESWPVLLFLGILVLIFAWGVIDLTVKMRTTRENRKIIGNKVAELEGEKAKLSSDIARLETESGIEENIRDKFGLAKEGEGLIVVVEDKEKVEVEDESSGGFFNFFRNLFK